MGLLSYVFCVIRLTSYLAVVGIVVNLLVFKLRASRSSLRGLAGGTFQPGVIVFGSGNVSLA